VSRPKLLFISPRFLFPIDSGGKIRTTGILREMKGGAFEITLLCPQPPNDSYEEEMATVADHWHYWPATDGIALKLKRVLSLFSAIPIPVASDASSKGRKLINEHLASNTDVAIFDFTHAAVLASKSSTVPRVLFTHNVEAEIFARHADVATNPLMKSLWRSQWRKMLRFEGDWIKRFTKSVAVSERDKEFFVREYQADNVETIPTGVDLNFFPYKYEPQGDTLVFTGSMDWPYETTSIRHERT